MDTILETRLLIFGLTRRTTAQEVQTLLGCCRLAQVEVLAEPGDADQAIGIVHLPADRVLAHRLAEQVDRRSLNGRQVRSWVPAMAWA